MMLHFHPSGVASGFLALVLTVGVIALDWLTPLGYAVPILYLIPLVLIGRDFWQDGVYWYAGGATLLAIVGYFVGPDGGLLPPAIFNRTACVIVLWGAAFVLSSEKRTSCESGFLDALRSRRWQEIMRHSTPCDPTNPDEYLPGVWEVVQGRRAVYSTEYGRMTASGFRWLRMTDKGSMRRRRPTAAAWRMCVPERCESAGRRWCSPRRAEAPAC